LNSFICSASLRNSLFHTYTNVHSQISTNSCLAAAFIFPTADVPIPLGPRTIPMPQTQQSAANQLSAIPSRVSCFGCRLLTLYRISLLLPFAHKISVSNAWKTPILGCVETPLPFNGLCLQNHYLLMATVYLLVLWSSSFSFCHFLYISFQCHQQIFTETISYNSALIID
jgi:hypothetical protein